MSEDQLSTELRDKCASPIADDLIAPGSRLRDTGDGVLSAIAAGSPPAPYDRHAQIYDRLVGGRLYNRVVWGVRVADYVAFATDALNDGDGPFLDAGCGTAVFTASAYRHAQRPLVLVDRSLGMLRRAAKRLDDVPATLIQADIESLPFSPGSFDTVACFAVLHVLDDPWQALAALRDQVAPGGRLYASMLVSDRGGMGRRYLSMLHRRGEVGPPQRAVDLQQAADELFTQADVSRTGSMAWLRAAMS